MLDRAQSVAVRASETTFWNDCDELIQEWLNNVQELVASEDLLFCDEGHGES